MSRSTQDLSKRERFTNHRVVVTFIAIAMTTVAGVAFGYVGEWGRGEEPTTRNVIVLGTWIFLIMALTLSQLLFWSQKVQVALASVLLLFVFGLFATYRHQQMGNLGDSPLYFQIATYQTSFGTPRQLSLSSLLAGPLNQALFDIGFKNLWIVPLVLGFVFFLLVVLSPRLLSSSISIKRWFSTAVLLFISGSFILYFFRTYMEFYTFPALVLYLALLVALRGLKSPNLSVLIIAGLLLGIAPLFHTLVALFSALIWLVVVVSLFRAGKNLWFVTIFTFSCVVPLIVTITIAWIADFSFSQGNLWWADQAGWISSSSLDSPTFLYKVGVLVSSFPFAVYVLFESWFHRKDRSSQRNSICTAWVVLLGLITLGWTFGSLYNFAGGFIIDRDLIIIFVIPALAAVVAVLTLNGLGRDSLTNYGLLFSCVVTATIVTSFIEPTFDTAVVVQLVTPWRS